MSALEFVIISLAAYRASRALALDSITEPLRERLMYWSDGQATWKQKVAELVSCGFCCSFWLSGITYLVFLLATERWSALGVWEHGIVWWSLAGASSMLIAVDSFLLREAPPGD